MLNFNELKEDINFNDIKNGDNIFLADYFNKIFDKLVNGKKLTKEEKKLFILNRDNGCVYKYKVKDKEELQNIIANRLEPFVKIVHEPSKFNADGFLQIIFHRIEMNLNWLNVSDITDMSNLFNISWYGQFFIISDWDVSNVTDMSGMFYKITNFDSDISKWDVSNVTNMQDMFNGCHDFNQDLSKWNVSKVTNMQEMFNMCMKFNLDISTWDVSSVNNMIGMFNMCIEFNLNLSNWDVRSLLKFNDIFNNCVKLQNKPDWYYDYR